MRDEFKSNLPTYSVFKKSRPAHNYKGRAPIDWYCYFTIDGKRKHHKLCLAEEVTKSQATELAIRWYRNELEPQLRKKQVPIEKYVAGFLDHCYSHQKTKGYKRYKVALEWFLEYLRKNYPTLIYLGELDYEIGEGFIEWRKTNNRYKKKTAFRTINNDMTIIKTALGRAVRLGLIINNPFREVKPLSLTVAQSKNRSEMNPAETNEGRRLTQQEIDLLLDNAGAFYDVIYTLLSTGLRLNELRQLTWSNIDEDSKHIFVDGDLKNQNSRRFIPVTKQLLQLLIKRKAHQNGEVVFPEITTKGHNWALGQLKKVVKKAGIDGNVRIHDLRHTFISMILDLGCPPAAQMAVSGHKHFRTSLKYYHGQQNEITRPFIENILGEGNG